MESLTLRFVFDRKKQATDKTAGLLQIEVRKLRSNEKVYISTGIKLFKNQFSNKNGFTCKNHLNSISINGQAKRIFREVEAFIYSDRCLSISDVKFWDKEDNKVDFLSFLRTELRKSNPTKSTLEHHNALFKKLEDFGKINHFSDVSNKNINEFDIYLKENGVTASATLNKRHTTLRKYIKKAIYLGLCEKDPYIEFSMPSKKNKTPTFLIESEINKILKYDPENDRMSHVKDLFIFQIFTGLSYIDLMQFSKEYISEENGYKIISNSRYKTKEIYISLFLPEAEAIANKYNYNLPKLSNQKYNDYLKLLGIGSGIKKTLTSHVARHTFATYLLNKDVPIETVSKAMGHSNIKMTQHYAKLLGKKVINDMSKLFEA